MRQAIVTKYFGPTNTKGSRIKVKAYAGSKFYEWDHSVGIELNHLRAATKFADKMGWLKKNDIVGGSMPKSGSYCFVLVNKGTGVRQ